MSSRVARLTAKHPLVIFISWIILAGLALTLAFTGFGERALFDRLHAGVPTIQGSDTKAAAGIRSEHGLSSETMLIAVEDVDLTEISSQLPARLSVFHSNVLGVDGVAQVTSLLSVPDGPTSPAAAPFIATDQSGFSLTVSLDVAATTDQQIKAHDQVEVFAQELAEDFSGTLRFTSGRMITDAINSQMQNDLISGEMIALPISLVILVVVFGGILAAGMPLVAAASAIGVALGALWFLSHPMTIESVVVNLITLLGLALSIDYGLLMVSRYREEIEEITSEPTSRRRQHHGVQAALERTIATAGRTVTFSAITIACAIAGLLFLRPEILRSLAVGGMLVVFLGWLSAVTLIPACLAMAHKKLLQPSPILKLPLLGALTKAVGDSASDHGIFAKLGRWVTKRAVVITTVAAVLLIVATLPLGSLKLNNSTIEMLPQEHSARQTWDGFEDRFPLMASTPAEVLVEEIQVEAAESAIAKFPEFTSLGVRADLEQPYVSIPLLMPDIDPSSSQAHQLIRDLRIELGDIGLVDGKTASEVDFNDALAEGAPFAIGVIILATFILLFLMTGSILVPLKALVINILSIAASLGITTWVFAQGNGESLLNYTSLGGLESYGVAVVVAFGFGLAMDYEVFLLARIKERYDEHHDNDRAVVEGLQRTGRVITSAALVMIVVFCGFLFAQIFAIKQVGFALALTVLLDATLVRLFLVPSTMKLLGHMNWWAPKPLARMHKKFGIKH